MSRPVVVGIDGSPASRQALRLAVEEARARKTRVRAVHVWHVAEDQYLTGFAPPADEVERVRVQARRILEDTVALIAGEHEVAIESVLLEDRSAAAALIAESGQATLLVVGSRGLHGLKEFVLGSVSHACCQRARCPVLVVPAGSYEAG